MKLLKRGENFVLEREGKERVIMDDVLDRSFKYEDGEQRAALRPIGHRFRGYWDLEEDRCLLGKILQWAQRRGVETDKAAEEYYDRLTEEGKRLCEAEAAQRKAALKEQIWKDLCRNGCRSCKAAKQCTDDEFICAATGEKLETRNVPYYDLTSQIYYLTRAVPFPNERCPKRA